MAAQLRILALDDYTGAFKASAAGQRLQAIGHTVDSESRPLRGLELVEAASRFDALVLTQQRTPMPREVLAGLPQLRWLLQTGRNVAHVDQEACQEQGVEIVKAGGGNATPPSEMTWALILAAAKRLVENSASLRQGRWQTSPCFNLQGKVLGVLGLGNIGCKVATVGAAFGMEVCCSGRPGGATEAAATENGFRFVSKEELFRLSDVLSIHVKASAESKGCVTSADLALMKPSSILVNTSRASLIEQGALVPALRAGRPGYAALDVFDEEPLPMSDELLGLSNVLLAPHLGYATMENLEEIYGGVVADFLARLEQRES